MQIARIVVAAVVLTAGVASAQGVKGTGSYGTAGCGLGSMAFGNQKGGIQILAATTNGLFGTQTFGITSGTSNCGEAAMSASGTKTFIEGNRETLAKDAARGAGETVDTLSAMAGCGDAKAVGAVLQQRFGELFPAGAADEQVSASVLRALRSEPLACRNLG